MKQISPLQSARRIDITPTRIEERPSIINRNRKVEKSIDTSSNVPIFEASLFKSMELNL
jgi:hypothetical protein